MKAKSFISIAAVVCLLVVGAVSSTYAYWNQTSTIENPFDTGDFAGSVTTEDFKPGDGEDWQPGVEVNKKISTTNLGDVDLIIRARLDETWTRKGETTPYKDSKASGYNVYATSQANATDGLTVADGSVVTKTFSGSTNWVNGGDGWYYYKVNLGKNQTTDNWVESVALLDDADMGNMVTTHYVSASNDPNPALWVWYPYTGTMPGWINASGVGCLETAPGARQVLHNKVETAYASATQKGYSNSEYVLKVTVESVQATQDAIDAMFGGGSSFTAPAGTTWTVG